MRPPRVALIATEPGTARARELLGRAFSRVRLEGGAPEVSLIPLAEAIAPNSGEQRLAEADLAVAYCPKRLAATDLYRLGAVLAAAGTPGLMLMDRPDEALARLHPGAVFVRGVRADAAGLAGLLEGLLGRQAALRALQAELRLANSLRSGTSAEIERLHEELLLAAHVQREFLPQGLPTLAGIDAAVLFRPTGFVSGDIYDLAMLDQHRLGFYLADAMGHGLSAALMTLFIAGNLHLRHPSRAGDPLPYRLVSPGTALARLNTALLGTHAGLGRMVSAVCGVLDVRDGTLRLAAAGHPAPWLISGGTRRALEVAGTLLGVDEDAEYRELEVRLGPGDAVVLHSDGLSDEAAGQGRIPWLDALQAATPETDLTHALAAAEFRLDSATGSLHQHDDVTIMAVGVPAAARSGTRAA